MKQTKAHALACAVKRYSGDEVSRLLKTTPIDDGIAKVTLKQLRGSWIVFQVDYLVTNSPRSIEQLEVTISTVFEDPDYSSVRVTGRASRPAKRWIAQVFLDWAQSPWGQND